MVWEEGKGKESGPLENGRGRLAVGGGWGCCLSSRCGGCAAGGEASRDSFVTADARSGNSHERSVTKQGQAGLSICQSPGGEGRGWITSCKGRLRMAGWVVGICFLPRTQQRYRG